jgi:hypothetical protein
MKEILMTKWIRAAAVALLLLMAGLTAFAQNSQAQDVQDTAPAAEDDLPEIDYIRSPTGFNVPVLGGNWDNVGDNITARFVNEDINAVLQVTSVDTLDVNEAIVDAISEQIDGDLPDEPIYRDRISLTSGNWTQVVYQIDDVTVSALGVLRSDTSYVISLLENNADADIYEVIVRAPLPESAETIPEEIDPAIGVQVALEALFEDEGFEAEPDTSELAQLPSGQWRRTTYATDDLTITTHSFQFGSTTYVSITDGDTQLSAESADAFATVFLGFFITPVTTNFLWLGLGSTALVFGLLLFSMYWRSRNADKDLELIEQLAEED